MEPHELDKYIGKKLREAENSVREGEISGMNRVWSTVETRLENQASFYWLKIAAVFLLLLMPSVYLYFRNREQGRQIADLNSKLVLIEKSYRQKLQAFTVNQPDKVVVQHDTIRLTRTVERKIIPETVEIVKYRTDTVILYRQITGEQNLAGSEPVNSGENESTMQESSAMTEYILAKDASSNKKKKKSRSFQIRLGTGNSSAKSEPDLAFKTKL